MTHKENVLNQNDAGAVVLNPNDSGDVVILMTPLHVLLNPN